MKIFNFELFKKKGGLVLGGLSRVFIGVTPVNFIGNINEDPEFIEYKKNVLEKEKNKMADDCEHHRDRLIDCSERGLSYLSDDNRLKDDLLWHRQLKEGKVCHFFNDKKYCYHKGKEIIRNA